MKRKEEKKERIRDDFQYEHPSRSWCYLQKLERLSGMISFRIGNRQNLEFYFRVVNFAKLVTHLSWKLALGVQNSVKKL